MRTDPRDNANSPCIFTIGYEGRSIDGLIKELKERCIEMVVDVRGIPSSRKSGFSKRQLSGLLQQNDIEYRHIGGLGSPPEARRNLRNTGNIHRFVDEYLRHLREHQDQLCLASELTEEHNCCLLCFERNAYMCHRTLIALELQKISRNGEIEVIHL